MIWVVCALRANRQVEPEVISGTWRNGATCSAKVYPSQCIPLVDQFGVHSSRNDALKALVLCYHPELSTSSIDHLKRVAKTFLQGSTKTYKLLSFANTECIQATPL